MENKLIDAAEFTEEASNCQAADASAGFGSGMVRARALRNLRCWKMKKGQTYTLLARLVGWCLLFKHSPNWFQQFELSVLSCS